MFLLRKGLTHNTVKLFYLIYNIYFTQPITLMTCIVYMPNKYAYTSTSYNICIPCPFNFTYAHYTKRRINVDHHHKQHRLNIVFMRAHCKQYTNIFEKDVLPTKREHISRTHSDIPSQWHSIVKLVVIYFHTDT